MKYYISDNRDKSKPYREALNKYGYQETSVAEADFVLLDHNWKDGYRDATKIFRECRADGKKIFMFPHGFRCNMFWDAIYTTDDNIDAFFAPASGHIMVMKAGGYPAPMISTGFPWCKVKKWEPVTPVKILFAPIHPDWGETYIYSQFALEWNKEAWAKIRLLKHKKEITVYHGLTPEVNGLTTEDEIIYHRSDLTIDAAVALIDKHDLIIAHDTFAALAIARGKSVIMFNDHFYHAPNGMISKYWGFYERAGFIYPHNIIGCDDLDNLILQAGRPDTRVATWKTNFIGVSFDPYYFISKIKEFTE